MLTKNDLQAIDKLIQKRTSESSERLERNLKSYVDNRISATEAKLIVYVDKRIAQTEKKLKNYFTKLFNFLDRDLMNLKKRVEKLEKNSHYS